MRLVLRGVETRRGTFHLAGTGAFFEGIHLVWGPVGCGKTTLALLLAGLLSPQQGEIQKEGIGRTGFLMQFPEYQVTSRTLTEEVGSWGIPPDPVLRETNLGDRRDCDPLTLSRGELKRLLLSTILHTNPDLLLLDEPFGGMDCQERGKLIDRISTTPSRITILFSHDHGMLPPLNHLWEIEEGQLIYRGAMPEALAAWSSPPPYLLPLIARGILSPHDSLEESRRRA
jgi:energy-coupling factor transporter ATP-binding protein EcfA2